MTQLFFGMLALSALLGIFLFLSYSLGYYVKRMRWRYSIITFIVIPIALSSIMLEINVVREIILPPSWYLLILVAMICVYINGDRKAFYKNLEDEKK